MIEPRLGDLDDAAEELDLSAVARDDELLDLLGARAGLPATLADDRAVALLQALTRDVDEELAALRGRPLPAAEAAPDPRARSRRRAARGTVLALVVGAAVSVGGVSAAVTGDPFSAYRAVVGAFTPGEDLPPNAAQVARWNRALANTRAVLRAGDRAQAERLAADLEASLATADLTAGQRAALRRKLDVLRERIAAAAEQPGPATPKGTGRSSGAGGRSGGSGAGQGTSRGTDHGKDSGPARPGGKSRPDSDGRQGRAADQPDRSARPGDNGGVTKESTSRGGPDRATGGAGARR